MAFTSQANKQDSVLLPSCQLTSSQDESYFMHLVPVAGLNKQYQPVRLAMAIARTPVHVD